MSYPDVSPTAVEVEYTLTIKAWPVMMIGGDAGGLKLRFDDGRILASSYRSGITTGKDSAKEGIEKCLEYLLNNIENIQNVAEKNAENLCTIPELMPKRAGNV